MSIEPYKIAIFLSYVLMGWFFISVVLSLWSKSHNTLSSITLFLAWSVYSYVLSTKSMAHLSTPQMYEVIAWYDVITALTLTMWLKRPVNSSFIKTLPEWLRYDNFAWKYALIVLVAAICHFVMLRDVVLLLDKSVVSYIPSIIYAWYDELIILTQVLQLMVATYGMVGMVGAIRKLRKDNRLCSLIPDGYNKSIPAYNGSVSIQKNSEDQK